MPRRFFAILFLGAAWRLAAAPRDALVFVAGPAHRGAALSSSMLRNVGLGRVTRWPDGRRIVLAVRPGSTAAGRLFFERVVDTSEIDYSRLWLGLLFRGEAESAPRVLADAAEVQRFVARTADGLAFLLSSEIRPRDPALNPLPVDGRVPGAPGYPYTLAAP